MEKDYQLLSTFGCTENGGSRNSGAQSTVDERAPLRLSGFVIHEPLHQNVTNHVMGIKRFSQCDIFQF